MILWVQIDNELWRNPYFSLHDVPYVVVQNSWHFTKSIFLMILIFDLLSQFEIINLRLHCRSGIFLLNCIYFWKFCNKSCSMFPNEFNAKACVPCNFSHLLRRTVGLANCHSTQAIHYLTEITISCFQSKTFLIQYFINSSL